jgi:hypothetical protein
MSSTRRSTVYDLADLRLHPDGTRVNPTSSNTSTSKLSVLDYRGRRIAQDAGGLGRIPKRKTVPSTASDEDISDSPSLVNVREAKRRKFAQDFSFLDGLPWQNSSPSQIPPPSSVSDQYSSPS